MFDAFEEEALTSVERAREMDSGARWVMPWRAASISLPSRLASTVSARSRDVMFLRRSTSKICVEEEFADILGWRRCTSQFRPGKDRAQTLDVAELVGGVEGVAHSVSFK